MKKFWPKKNKTNNYLLVCFGNFNQTDNKIVKAISDEIMPIVTSENVKYYNNVTTIIYHFTSDKPLQNIVEFITDGVKKYAGMHILITLGDQVDFVGPDELLNYLYDLKTPKNEDESINVELLMNKTTETEIPEDVILSMYEDLKNEIFGDGMDDEEDDDLEKIIRKKKEEEKPSLDYLLDKISSQGMGSLSKKEKELLEYYSSK